MDRLSYRYSILVPHPDYLYCSILEPTGIGTKTGKVCAAQPPAY